MIRIEKSNYAGLIAKWGEEIKQAYLAEKLNEGKVLYFYVYDDDKLISDFWVYTENNELCISKMNYPSLADESLFNDENFMNEVFETLKKYVDFITAHLISNNKIEEKAISYGFVYKDNYEVVDAKNEVNVLKIYEKKLN